MPFDSMLVSAAVIAVFVGLAAVLIWADFSNAAATAAGRCASSKAPKLLRQRPTWRVSC